LLGVSDDARAELHNTLGNAAEIETAQGGYTSDDSQGSVAEELHDILDSLYGLSSALDAVWQSMPRHQPLPIELSPGVRVVEEQANKMASVTPVCLILQIGPVYAS